MRAQPPFPSFLPRLAPVVVATLSVAPYLPSRRYRKGFELQPTLYSGINLTVLLIVAGQQFENSMELRKIGTNLGPLLTFIWVVRFGPLRFTIVS